MLRRMLIAAVVTTTMLTGLLVSAPTSQAQVYDNSIGSIQVPDQRWRPRCHDYLLRWTFTPPNGDWTVKAKVRSPRGFAIRTLFWDANSPNKLGQRQGSMRFGLCGASVKPGRYKVEMQMIYNEGRDVVTKNRKPTYFRLFRR